MKLLALPAHLMTPRVTGGLACCFLWQQEEEPCLQFCCTPIDQLEACALMLGHGTTQSSFVEGTQLGDMIQEECYSIRKQKGDQTTGTCTC